MNAAALIRHCRAEGVTLSLAGDRLEIEGDFDDALVDRLRAAKPAIVAVLRRDPADCLVTDVWEAASIRAGDAPEVTRDHLDGAAQDMGRVGFDTLIAEALDRWASDLRGCDHAAVKDAHAHWHQIEIAARLGWGTQALFAERHGLIPRIGGLRVRVLSRDLAKSDCGVIWPRREWEGDRLIWTT